MRGKFESNRKPNSMAKAIMVRWKWNDELNHRIFLGLRRGGITEDQYDLSVRYPEKSEEKISLLVHSDQLANLSREEKIDKIIRLLTDSSWKWDPDKVCDFHNKVDRFVRK